MAHLRLFAFSDAKIGGHLSVMSLGTSELGGFWFNGSTAEIGW